MRTGQETWLLAASADVRDVPLPYVERAIAHLHTLLDV
jgi:hypothetical protein